MLNMKLTILILLVTNSLGHPEIYSDYKNHPCKRQCINGEKKTCHYHFTVEFMYTPSNNCMACLNGTTEDCFNPQCIVADGRYKVVNVVNRMIPGPSIEICEGDKVIVDVYNDLGDVSTSIHFHGLRQFNRNEMDGVPMVSQEPIMPGKSFRYEFVAKPAGTRFYHSHSNFQRLEGLFGPLIIRTPKDFPPLEHVITLTDWTQRSARDIYLYLYKLKKMESNIYTAILVNSLGSTIDNNVPFPIFNVDKGEKYRFRVINAGGLPCYFKISIENHNISIVSVDGFDVAPAEVDSFYITHGERLDFMLNANQEQKNYWMTIEGFLFCENTASLASIQYNLKKQPSKQDFKLTHKFNERIFNDINNRFEESITYNDFKSVSPLEKELMKTPDFQYYITYDMYNNTIPIHEDITGIQVEQAGLNNITFVTPNVVLAAEGTSEVNVCNLNNIGQCGQGGDLKLCLCTHIVEIPFNKTVELILIQEGKMTIKNSHPMHLHGYSFRVLAIKKVADTLSRHEFEKLDKNGHVVRNYDYPVLKDTIEVPSGGYAILRFVSNNPGYWMFHCHVEFHTSAGMAMIFKVKNSTNDL